MVSKSESSSLSSIKSQSSSSKSLMKIKSLFSKGSKSNKAAGEVAKSITEEIEELIPAKIIMISGCKDSQTSADVADVASFKLPDPAGRSGGACTSALLNVLYEEKKMPPANDLAWVETLEGMRRNLKSQGYDQIPQLSSSRKIDINRAARFTNSNHNDGTKRALLIGINYVGQEGELSGCHNDVNNMKHYLKVVEGFQESEMMILMDDNIHTNPTRDNIMKSFQKLAESSKPGDSCFLHYSGHGGKIRDTNNDEDDKFDETLVPVDYNTAGQIRDDDLFKSLVQIIPQGVLLTCIMDSCHSGSVLDLPYKYVADGRQTDMTLDGKFDMTHLQNLAHNFGGKLHNAFKELVFSGAEQDLHDENVETTNNMVAVHFVPSPSRKIAHHSLAYEGNTLLGIELSYSASEPKTTNSQEKVTFHDKNTNALYNFMQAKNWKALLDAVDDNPELVSTWFSGTDVDTKWCLLPIHLAVICKAPIYVVARLSVPNHGAGISNVRVEV